MKLDKILNEEWHRTIADTDIFKNPSPKDVIEMSRNRSGIRYLLPKSGSGDVYAWSDSGYSIHENVIPKLGLNGNDFFWMHLEQDLRFENLDLRGVSTISEVQLRRQYFPKSKLFDQWMRMIPKLIEEIQRAMGNRNAGAIIRRGVSISSQRDTQKKWLESWARSWS